MINILPYLYCVGPVCVGGISVLCEKCFDEVTSRDNVGLRVLVCVYAWAVRWGCVYVLYGYVE
jgi:hypothetical protein